MSERFYVTLSRALPEEKRDVRGKLRHADTWRDGKKATPRSGEWATGSVELTPSEVEKVRAASNVLRVEKIPPAPTPDVDAAIPSDVDLRGHKADTLYEWGFTGTGIDVGVIDTGLGARDKFNIKAILRDGSADTLHGTQVASIAVPRASQLVFSGAQGGGQPYSNIVDDVYTMVDTIGIHVLAMSFGSYDPFAAMADAMAYAKSKNVAIFASAGNDGRNPNGAYYPAGHPGVKSVGALDRAAGWKRASFSNYGSWVDLWASGVNVAVYGPDGTIDNVDGTSFSAPLAAYIHASLLTKGLTSIGQVGAGDAVRRGSDSPPGGVGGDPSPAYDPSTGSGGGSSGGSGGRRINGENAAFAMREFCV